VRQLGVVLERSDAPELLSALALVQVLTEK